MASLLGSLRNRLPVPLTTPWRSIYGANVPEGTEAHLRAMGSVGTLFAIANRTAESVAQVEWKLYRKRTDARRSYEWDGMSERREVTQHLALKVWNNPNKFMTRQEVVEAFTQHMCLVGESWLSVGRNDRASFPLELWPVRPDRMRPIEDPEEYITGYEYRNPLGQWSRLEINEVVFMRRPNPLDSYRGMGPVQSVMAELDANRYSAEWNRAFFQNSAEPGGIIKASRKLSDPEFDQIQMRWNESHKGVRNAGRVAILEGEALEWVERQYSQRDMQFAELSTLSSEKIREAFAFPKPLLGTVEDVNRANADAAEVIFARWTLKSYLERIKHALNNDFLPMFGSTAEGVEFDYCLDVPEDTASENDTLRARSEAVNKLVTAGFNPEGVLKAVGLPPIDFGTPAAASSAVPGGGTDASMANALRWEVKADLDGNTCGPCRSNDGKLYRNRASAYTDYPGGSNYVRCTGEQYGNDCRCQVVKRGQD